MGYAVAAEPSDLNLEVFVRKNRERNLAGQMAVMYWFGWNFGAGDACVEADAKLVEASSGDVLLEFNAKRTALTNYDATRSWVNALTAIWRKHM